MKNILRILFLLISAVAMAQPFTRMDSLKGSDTVFRNFWDVKKYELTVEVNADRKFICGKNKISFEIIKDIQNPVFQIDLQQPMQFKPDDSDYTKFTFERDGDFIWVKSKKPYRKGDRDYFTLHYSGHPVIAKNAPWEGGWVFSEDKNRNPFISVAQESIGTSVWLPVKDIWNDEPDEGIIMQITTPKHLTGIGNGKLISKTHEKDKNIFLWEVKNPINTYSIVPNIGNYVHIKDTFSGEKGTLSLEYWVLSEHVELAKKQFTQVKPMLEAFEYWFGPYPFYEDGFKMVETPFLGMEHQSNIAYGNGYQNGYLGSDLSGTGIGLKWDFILVHESGHEWFGNSITTKDQADMWIHEAFTSYSETLFTEHYLDKISAEKYLQGTRQNILNDSPIIGQYGVRNTGSTDMYFKGASMLHTIRQIMDNDHKFRLMLRKMNEEFYHKTVTSIEIEKFISEFSGFDFSGVFEQYLRTTKIPVFEYSQKGNILEFRYSQVIKNLNLPLKINGNQLIKPSENWQSVTLESSKEVKFNPNYYVHYLKVNR